MADTVDVDLDALAPQPKRVKLAGHVWKLPGDLPMPLYLRMQRYEQRVRPEDEGGGGEDEAVLLEEIGAELLKLFQHHQPKLAVLPGTAETDRPQLGLTVLLKAIGAIYGAASGEAQPAVPASQKRTTTKTSSARSRAARRTSR